MTTCADAIIEVARSWEGGFHWREMVRHLYRMYPSKPWKETPSTPISLG